MSLLFDLSPLFDVMLSFLLVITIIYAIILNKKLKTFHEARAAMASLAGDLDAAVRRAEEGLAKVRTEAEKSGTRLVQRSEAAKHLANDLALLEERATRAGDRLEKLSARGRDELRPFVRKDASGAHRSGPARTTKAPADVDETSPLVRALRGLR